MKLYYFLFVFIISINLKAQLQNFNKYNGILGGVTQRVTIDDKYDFDVNIIGQDDNYYFFKVKQNLTSAGYANKYIRVDKDRNIDFYYNKTERVNYENLKFQPLNDFLFDTELKKAKNKNIKGKVLKFALPMLGFLGSTIAFSENQNKIGYGIAAAGAFGGFLGFIVDLRGDRKAKRVYKIKTAEILP